jgi:hypothetical protein
MVALENIQTVQPDDGEPLSTEIDPEKETNEAGWIIHSSGSKF